MPNPCKRKGCVCSHELPCDYGWINTRYKVVEQKTQRDGTINTIEKWYDGASPCPTCDPERAHIIANSTTSEEVTEKLRQRSAFNHTKIQNEIEESRTRTL